MNMVIFTQKCVSDDLGEGFIIWIRVCSIAVLVTPDTWMITLWWCLWGLGWECFGWSV